MSANPMLLLEFDRSWQDVFGTVLASIEHGSRKRTVLIVTSNEFGPVARDSLAGITFQGRLVLAILEQLHRAPLEAVLRDQAPNFVIALKQTQTGIATYGPAISGEPSFEISSTGLEYAEPGSYPAWTNQIALAGHSQTLSVTGSVASSLGLPCFVCQPSDLQTALELAFQK
jgi:hypothetical protein